LKKVENEKARAHYSYAIYSEAITKEREVSEEKTKDVLTASDVDR